MGNHVSVAELRYYGRAITSITNADVLGNDRRFGKEGLKVPMLVHNHSFTLLIPASDGS